MKVLMFLLRTTSPETRGAGPGPGLRSSMTKQGSAMLRVQDAALAAHGASTSRGGDLVASEGDLEAESEQAGQYRRLRSASFRRGRYEDPILAANRLWRQQLRP